MNDASRERAHGNDPRGFSRFIYTLDPSANETSPRPLLPLHRIFTSLRKSHTSNIMSRYGNEVPMDFEWGNGTGALDGRSPFAQVSSNAQRFPPSSPVKKGELGYPERRDSGERVADNWGCIGSYGSSQLSPSKTRMMGTQQSSPNKALPPVPAFNSLFSTPRKPRPEIDDSSAGETPKSPERGGESDATPEIVNTRTAMSLFDSASAPAMGGAERERRSPTKERHSPTKERPQAERRDSLVNRLMSKAKKIYSPGRGELPRSEHAGAIEKRTRKKRKHDVDRRVARQRRQSLSDSESERPRRSPRKRSGHNKPPPEEKDPHWMSSLFTFIGAHPSVPHILSYYAQFLFNVFLLSCCGYLIYCFWHAIQNDVNQKANEAVADVMADMAKCAHDYQINYCERAAPALKLACLAWEKCMKQDPYRVSRAKVSAGTFAGIFNEFVEGISWKAMAFTTVIVLGSFGMSNFVSSRRRKYHGQLKESDANDWKAFGFFRHKAQDAYGYGYNGPPPPTPLRAFSGQDGSFYHGTPWQQMPPQGMGLEPQPSGAYGQIEGQGSPVRRLAYS